MFRHVSQSEQTLGNISEKHRETSNVSEFARKHFCFSESKFCFRNNVSTGGQTGKHLRKHRESQMFPQQCFLVCPGLNYLFNSPCTYHIVAGNPEEIMLLSYYSIASSSIIMKLSDFGRGVLTPVLSIELTVFMRLLTSAIKRQNSDQKINMKAKNFFSLLMQFFAILV
jgi:hypothetical protein